VLLIEMAVHCHICVMDPQTSAAVALSLKHSSASHFSAGWLIPLSAIIKQIKRVGCGYRNMINYQRRILSHIAVTRLIEPRYSGVVVRAQRGDVEEAGQSEWAEAARSA
jgi:hypothetical protein